MLMVVGVSAMMGGLENGNVAIILNEILGTPFLHGSISGITDESGSPQCLQDPSQPPKWSCHLHQSKILSFS